MTIQSEVILPAPAGTYLVIAQSACLATFDPVIAYRISGERSDGVGSRVALLASGDEVELAEDYAEVRDFGVMDPLGRVCSGGLLFHDVESFCEAIFGG